MCQASFDAWLARGVHASRRTDLRDEILARSFHRRECNTCQTRLELEQPFVYTDFDLEQWIYVATDDDRASWPAWEARLIADVHRMFSLHSPLVHPLGEQLRSRLVFGTEELREKLVVWQAGLDDALVECIKVRAVAEHPALATKALVVDRVVDDHITLVAGAQTLELPRDWLTDSDRDRSSLQLRFPELFQGGYVSFRRLTAPACRTEPDRT